MRSMIVAVLFFALSIGTVAFNAVYVTDFLEETSESLGELPEASPDDSDLTHLAPSARQLCEKFSNNFFLLSLSINTEELRDCASAIESLAAYTGTSEPADYNAALSEARLRIGILLQRERFSLINII